MKLRFALLTLACVPALAGVIACAANGSIFWAFVCAVLLIVFSFAASWTWDQIQELAVIADLTKHHRI